MMARRRSPTSSDDTQQQYFDPFGAEIDPNQQNQQQRSQLFTFPSESSPPNNNFFQDDFGFPTTHDPAWTVATGNFPAVATAPKITDTANTESTLKILDTTTRTASTTNSSSMNNESLDYSSQDSAFSNLMPHVAGEQQFQTTMNDFRGSLEGFDSNHVFPAETGNTAFAPISGSRQTQFIPSLKPSPIRKMCSPKTLAQTEQPTGAAALSTAMIEIKVEERLSIYLDDSTSIPSCRVIGKILMAPISNDHRQQLQHNQPTKPSPSFCLTIRDRKATIERWEEQPEICKNITASLTHLSNLDTNDQVFRVSIEHSKQHQQQHRLLSEEASPPVPIIAYSCHSNLKPIPVLVKTKVIRKVDRCRVGIRFRANPNNGYRLKDVTIVMVVPPDIDGENNVSISRKGGIWDVMKRTLSWMIPELAAGEVIDIQAQFQCSTPINQQEASPPPSTPKFPVLVQCNGNTNFSKIHLETDYAEEGSDHVDLKVENIATVLYRKV